MISKSDMQKSCCRSAGARKVSTLRCASPALLHAPTDHFQPATDLDRILFGRQEAAAGAPGGGAMLPAGAGFILK